MTSSKYQKHQRKTLSSKPRRCNSILLPPRNKAQPGLYSRVAQASHCFRDRQSKWLGFDTVYNRTLEAANTIWPNNTHNSSVTRIRYSGVAYKHVLVKLLFGHQYAVLSYHTCLQLEQMYTIETHASHSIPMDLQYPSA